MFRRWTIANPRPGCLMFRTTVVLLELPIERFTADAEGARGVRLIAVGVIERGLDGLPLDLFHRRRDRDLESCRASFAGSLRTLDFDPIAFLKGDLADRFGQIFEFDLAAGRDDHRALDRVLDRKSTRL